MTAIRAAAGGGGLVYRGGIEEHSEKNRQLNGICGEKPPSHSEDSPPLRAQGNGQYAFNRFQGAFGGPFAWDETIASPVIEKVKQCDIYPYA